MFIVFLCWVRTHESPDACHSSTPRVTTYCAYHTACAHPTSTLVVCRVCEYAHCTYVCSCGVRVSTPRACAPVARTRCVCMRIECAQGHVRRTHLACMCNILLSYVCASTCWTTCVRAQAVYVYGCHSCPHVMVTSIAHCAVLKVERLFFVFCSPLPQLRGTQEAKKPVP